MKDHPPLPDPTSPQAADAPDWDALARHAAGESSPEEARAVTAWLAAHPADAELVAMLGEATARLAAPMDGPAVDVEGALARVKARRGEEAAAVPVAPASAPTAPGAPAFRVERGGAPAGPVHAPARGRRLTIGLVALAAAVGALAVGLREWKDAPAPAPAGTTAGTVGGLRPLAAGGVLATPVGVRDSVRLSDGTRVVLAPGSRLAVAAGYGASAREVTVEGAALFSVTHDASRPFAVHAGSGIARDVGTVFTVRTDGIEGATHGASVSVVEGKVALRASAAPASSETLLSAGDRGTLGDDGTVRAERGTATADDAAWTDGRLVYRGAPLWLVRADLRRWYGVELAIADSALVHRRLTATFEGEPAARVLDVIGLALGARVDRAGDSAVLRPSTAH